MGALSDQSTSQTTKAVKEDNTAITAVGAGLPPIKRSLVAHTESGAFIKIRKFLPENLGNFTNGTSDQGKSKNRVITDTLEWVLCFRNLHSCFDQETSRNKLIF